MTERYRCAELLLRCALEVLEQGLNGDPMYTGYFKSKLGRAAEYYGLDVVDKGTTKNRVNLYAKDEKNTKPATKTALLL
jgi:hypothetical protein